VSVPIDLEIKEAECAANAVDPVSGVDAEDQYLTDALDTPTDHDVVVTAQSTGPKKRGRKPKGGKIVVSNLPTETTAFPEPSVILHLRCGKADLDENAFAIANPESVHQVEVEAVGGFQHGLGYQLISPPTPPSNTTPASTAAALASGGHHPAPTSCTLVDDDTDSDMKTIHAKLKELTYNLHTNNLADKKSACFWCTCDFDNPPIFLPKYELNNTYYCYGCFCSPECATAFLFREPIDPSIKFERYHNLIHIYCKIYDYTKNIKPAPDPFYTLNKYYGNLSIQEYRRLLKNERLLLIVDKPLSRTLPELHEDNDDFLSGGKSIPAVTKFTLKRKPKQSKTDILSTNFNLPRT
jgi:hypothetical protein